MTIQLNFCKHMAFNKTTHKTRPIISITNVSEAVQLIESKEYLMEVFKGDQTTKIYFDYDHKDIEKIDKEQVNAEMQLCIDRIISMFDGSICEKDIAIAERHRRVDGKFKISFRFYLPKFTAAYSLIKYLIKFNGFDNFFDVSVYKTEEQLMGCILNHKKRGDTKVLTPVTNHSIEDFIIGLLPAHGIFVDIGGMLEQYIEEQTIAKKYVESEGERNTISYDLLNKCVLEVIDGKRALNYDACFGGWWDMMTIIMNLGHINNYIKKADRLVHSFSKQVPEKYSEDKVDEGICKWKFKEDKFIGLGTLLKYMLEDNEEDAKMVIKQLHPNQLNHVELKGYSFIENEESNEKAQVLIDLCYEDGLTHDKVAKLFHALNNKIIYVGGDVFYERDTFGIYKIVRDDTCTEYILQNVKVLVTEVFNKYYVAKKNRLLKALVKDINCDAPDTSKQALLKDSIAKITKVHKENTKQLETMTFCKHVFEALKIELLRNKAAELMDSCPYLIGVMNGVLDLRNMELRNAHDDEYVSITLSGHLAKNPKDITPNDFMRWDTIINDWFFYANSADYVKKLLGSFLYKDNKEQLIHILTNEGSCGKTILEKALRVCFGAYYCGLASSYYTTPVEETEKACPLIYSLAKRRVVWTNETGNIKFHNEKYKTIGDGLSTWTVRTLHIKTYIDVDASFKPIISTNHLPKWHGDFAFAEARRTRIVPFQYKFVTQDVYDEAFDKSKLKIVNPRLDKDIVTQPYVIEFIMMLVYYYQKYQREGLQMSKCIEDATKEYFASMDILFAWRLERCEKNADEKVIVWSDDLYKDMVAFYHDETDENITNAMKKMTEAKFRKALQNADFQVKRTQRNKQNIYRVYGLRIRRGLDMQHNCKIQDNEDYLD